MAKVQKKSGAKGQRTRKLGVKRQPIRDLGPAEGGRRVKGGRWWVEEDARSIRRK